MTIFLRTDIDGKDTEGIGSICQWNLLLYCIAKYIGVRVSIPPFKNIAHYDSLSIHLKNGVSHLRIFLIFRILKILMKK